MKKLLLLSILSLIPSFSFASGIYNPGSGGGGGATTLPLPPGDTNYIQNKSTLQSPATFYVEKGSIQGIAPDSGGLGLGATDGLVSAITPTNGTVFYSKHTGAVAAGNYMNWAWTFKNSLGFDEIGGLIEPNVTGSGVGSITSDIDFYTRQSGSTKRVLKLRGTDLAAIVKIIDASTTTFNGVSYAWPLVQGGANTYAKNDGSGNITWATVAGGGGGAAALGVTTGTSSGYTTVISSPTGTIIYDAATTNGQLLAGTSYFFSLRSSSVTLQGNTFNGASQLVQTNGSSLISNSNIDGSSITKQGVLSAAAPITLASGVFGIDSSSATLLGPSIALGSETTGIYVGSLTVTSALAITGSNNVASAAPIIGINSSSVTALGPNPPAASIASGVMGSGVIVSSGGVGAISAVSGLTGALAAANFPALTGDVTTSAGSLTTTVVRVTSNALTPDSTTYARLNSTQTFSAAQTFNSTATFISSTAVNGPLFANGAVGTSGQYLQSNGAGSAPSWITPSASSSGGSALEVFSNSVPFRSSPTASVSLDSSMSGSQASSTATIGVSLSSMSAYVGTLTNKTFDANGTGNILAQTDTWEWNNTDAILSGTTYYTTTSSNTPYGHATFAGSNSTATCGVIIKGFSGSDFDTATDLTMILHDYGFASDISSRTYIVTVATYTTGLNVSTMSYGSPVTITIANTGSVGGLYKEGISASTTLTGWKSVISTSIDFSVAIRRQGDSATLDPSTVDSYFAESVITYGRRQ